MIINTLINSIFIMCSFYLSYNAIRRWLLEKFNHESIFFWGLSFVLLGVTHTLYFIDGFHNINGLNIALHTSDTFARVFQLYAILLSIIGCNYKHDCKICKKKIIRVSMWVILIPFLYMFPIAVFQSNISLEFSHGIMGLQIIGIRNLDIAIEIFHTILASVMFFVVPNKDDFSYIKQSFGLLIVSEVVQIINITYFNYTNMSLYEIEWATAVVSILLLFVSVNKIIKE